MLDFPDDDIDWTVSEEAKDLIRKLICPREIIYILFIRYYEWIFFIADPPYHPEVSSPTDTSNFDVDICEDDFTPCETQPPRVTAAFTGHHLPFIGFTYTHGSMLSDAKSLSDCISMNSSVVDRSSTIGEAYDKKLKELEMQKQELARKYQGMCAYINFHKTSYSLFFQLSNNLVDERNKVRKLEKEASEVEMNMAELQNKVDSLQTDLHKAYSARQEADMEAKKAIQVSELERLVKECLY
uniref:non-specific serine/threonine protein kinase n=1 Tax=Heterorhabditis bacteriophora TaxID=37862 RepID=A0A1I7XV42_HETBA